MSKIKIVCGKCTEAFGEHHSKIRGGLSVICPACAQPIIFKGNSEDLNARKALIAARRFRLEASAAQKS
jgi:DNA-directed RNA polymerase subunit RPC12/RpoP